MTVTLADAIRYHGKVAVLTAISGTLLLQGPDKRDVIAEGAIDGLAMFLAVNFGAGPAAEMLQQAADNVAAGRVKPKAETTR